MGSSLTGGTALCPWERHFILCLVLVQPRKTRPDITERLLTGGRKNTSAKERPAFCLSWTVSKLLEKVTSIYGVLKVAYCRMLAFSKSWVQIRPDFSQSWSGSELPVKVTMLTCIEVLKGHANVKHSFRPDQNRRLSFWSWFKHHLTTMACILSHSWKNIEEMKWA